MSEKQQPQLGCTDVVIGLSMQNGPSISIVEKCHGCQYLDQRMEWDEEYKDEGCVQRCVEPCVKALRGDDAIIYHDTPKWCPLRAVAIRAQAEKEVGLGTF